MIDDRLSYPLSSRDSISILRSGIVLVHEGLWMGWFSQLLTFLWALSGVYLFWSGVRLWNFRRLQKKQYVG